MSYSSRYSRGNAATTQKKETSDRNKQILKTLLNDPANKYCVDCKTAGHPRWASWSLGIFLCIRCSGIHRGMGTHISKVRSVDLDSWNDEHLEKMIKWGNKRANAYWEHKLPDDYVPDDSKIQNFIRTKYDMKRWVMPGPMPDPSTLGEGGDDSTPLAEVKQKLEADVKPSNTSAARPQPVSNGLIPDLLGDDSAPSPPPPPPPVAKSAATTATTVGANTTSTAQKTPAPPPKPQLQQQDSLLGLNFGSSSSAPAQPPAPARPALSSNSSTSTTTSGQSRPDLKKSILSLYANARPSVPQQQPVQQVSSPGFGAASNGSQFGAFDSFASPQPQQSAFDSLSSATSNLSLNQERKASTHDAFASLSFGNSSSSRPSVSSSNSGLKLAHNQNNNVDFFASTTSTAATSPQIQQHQQPSLFDSISTPGSTSTTTASNNWASNNDNNEWASFASAAPAATPSSQKNTNGIDDDLFNNVWK